MGGGGWCSRRCGNVPTRGRRWRRQSRHDKGVQRRIGERKVFRHAPILGYGGTERLDSFLQWANGRVFKCEALLSFAIYFELIYVNVLI
jgi:hypothetical protein